MKKNKRIAFTLVELIVVITILAILGTIAFINLQGYTRSARDSKRISDINNIQKKIGIEVSKGTSLSSLINIVKTNSGLTIDGNSATSIQGTANFQALKENGESFKDPITKLDYVLSYSTGGTGTGTYKFTQISTINEEFSQAVVKGNYYPMQVGDSPSIILNSQEYYVVDEGTNFPYLEDSFGGGSSSSTSSSSSSSSSSGLPITTYSVSGSFGVNANGATIDVCGTNVTADASGNFSTTRNESSVCNNIIATKVGYMCSTTIDGPISLTGDVTNISGSCTIIIPLYGNTDGSTTTYMPDGTNGTGRFTFDSGTTAGGTSVVLDNITGLYWQSEGVTQGVNTWDNAKVYCANLTQGGYSDWRLPDYTEILSIVDLTIYNPSMNTTYFTPANNYYWTSTTYINGDIYAWYVNLTNGSFSFDLKTNNHYVFCVR